MHYVDPDHWAALIAHYGPDQVPFGRTACGSAASARLLTTRRAAVTCSSCVELLAEAAPSQTASTVWLTTAQAAAHLGVDRSALDSRAADAATRLPEVVIQVGSGDARATYRWNRDRLPEVFAAASSKQKPSSSRPRTLRRIVGS